MAPPLPRPRPPRLFRRFRPRRPLTALAVLALVTTTVAGPARAAAPTSVRLDNPYLGARVYVNPEWSARAATEPLGAAVAHQPTAVWLDRITAIDGTGATMGLRAHLGAALGQDADLVQLVLYNLPGRDCDRRVSQGELTVAELDRYRTEFVDPIAEILADPAYAGLRIVVVVEPNSLPNLITHTSPRPAATAGCDEVRAAGSYLNGIGYALARLGPIANVYPYLDLGEHGKLGRPADLAPIAPLYSAAARAGGGTLANVHGFVVNTAGYAPLTEPFFQVGDVVNGEPVTGTRWVDGKAFVDELPYAQQLRPYLVGAGFPNGIGFLVDTSRNGWGGAGRPTGPGPRTTVEEYVETSRTDRRGWDGNWCNQTGAGIGARPVAAPAAGIDAYVWAKPPGESDGASDVLGANRPYEPMCDPWYRPSAAPYVRTGALGNAPPSGQWFPAHFRQLLANAWPPLP
ncbi:glycoside hydrolase family 6 protein [Plantactinospora sp. B24E8]|uniref:glycoside hydrolase family 6 protein n=1 Tax=Plantactinospora sp. B24E8 TaxID=3153567 RepID=UPI00325F6F6D